MKGIATPAYRPVREDRVFGDFFDSLTSPPGMFGAVRDLRFKFQFSKQFPLGVGTLPVIRLKRLGIIARKRGRNFCYFANFQPRGFEV